MTNKEAIEQLKWVKKRICDITYSPESFEALDLAIKALEERPHGEWIPVSERLPKIDAENGWKASDTVLVCLVDGMMHMGFYCEDKKWRFCESGEAKESFWKDVIAWMPLPKPYKEAENE